MKARPILLPILTLVLTAAALLGLSRILSGTARANIQAEHMAAMQTVLPGSTQFVLEPYSGDDAHIRRVHRGETGFVVETVTDGYAGPITLMVGVGSSGKVTGLVIRELYETWGLGAQALNDSAFLAQFLNASGPLEVGRDVDALTGATVTAKAVARGVSSAVAYVTGADVSTEATAWGG